MPAPNLSLRVTQIGEYIRYHSCDRRLKLEYNNREEAKKLPQITRLFTPLDPVLQEEGQRREESWQVYLTDKGLRNISQPDERGATSWEAFVEAAAELEPGERAFCREVALEADIGVFRLTGQIDFVLILWENGVPRLRLVECKASRKDRTYHRAQVATYQLMIERLIERGPNELRLHVVVEPDRLRTVSTEPMVAGRAVAHEDLVVEAVVARIDEDTNRGQRILELEPLDLENLSADVRRLLAVDGPFERIVRADLDVLDYKLEPKCDGCVFSVHCLPESARHRRLELLSLDPSTIRVLRERGIETIDDLAAFDPQSAQADQLRSQPSFIENVEHLVVRARVRRSRLPGESGDAYDVEALEGTGYGRLPEHEINGQRLVRVYLNVDYDYVENRVVALAAHVTTSEGKLRTGFTKDEDGNYYPNPELREELDDDSTRVPRGRNVVKMRTTAWTGNYDDDTKAERQLVESFLGDLVRAIRSEASRDRAPVHFYVWSRSDLTQLIEACSRSSSQLLAHLNELLGSREDLEQIIFTSLADEVNQRYATGWTGKSLAVTASLRWFGKSFHWTRTVNGAAVPLDRRFNRDLFDFKTVLHQHADGSWAYDRDDGDTKHLYEVRSRHFDTISAPYWHALWGTLPDPGTVEKPETARAIRTYQDATTEPALRALLGERVHAMRWIEEHIWKNRQLEKQPLDLAQLEDFSLGVDNIGRAALNVVRLDHRVDHNEWLSGMLHPPADRVTNGHSLPLSNARVVNGAVEAEIDMAGYDLSLEEMQRRSKFGVGSFVRVTPCSADPREGQSIFQILYGGRTCVVDSVDWETETVRLSHIFGKESRYVLPSSGLEWGKLALPFSHATMDESATAYVDRRVDQRLNQFTGSHVYEWFDPTEPRIPTAAPIGDAAAEQYERLLKRLRLPNGYRLDDSQGTACMEGLTAQIQLLLGPPGTGKTTTAGAAVLLRALALHERGDLILVAASTHTALNRLLEAIDETLPNFREAAEAVDLSFPPVRVVKVHSSSIGEPSAGGIEDTTAQRARTHIGAQAGDDPDGILILGGTTSALLKAADKYNGRVAADALIVDEASMLLFPHFLSLATLINEQARIMLAGDDRQLAPIVAHDWEEEDRPPTVRYQPYVSAYEAVRRLGGHNDVGERQVVQSALSHTFRLPASIRNLIAPVYRDAVALSGSEAGQFIGSNGQSPLHRAMHQPGGLFLALHDEDQSKQHNLIEADIIERLFDEADDLSDGSVALIAPHRAQCSLLRSRFGDHPAVYDIDTVNSFQGGECDTIIVSATVSDRAAIGARAEFVLGLERSNVAFSRAKQRLIVVVGRSLTDHMPAELEHYEAARLWKRLRALCTLEVGSDVIGGQRVQILTTPPA